MKLPREGRGVWKETRGGNSPNRVADPQTKTIGEERREEKRLLEF